jgi:peroxiredoxin
MKAIGVALALAMLLVIGGGGGVAAAAETPWIGIELDRGSRGGALIKGVIPHAPGERAGLHAGDEILAVDTVAATSPKALIETVRAAGIGHVVELRVLDKQGRERKVQLALEARPSPEKLQSDAVLGKPAPDFEPAVQAGAKVARLSAWRGHVVLIDFFATWCGPCVEGMPEVERWHRELGARGLRVLGVSTEDKRIVAGAGAKFHVTYPLASDEDEAVSQLYKVFALPTMVVIDRAGVVRAVAVNDPEVIKRALDDALAK